MLFPGLGKKKKRIYYRGITLLTDNAAALFFNKAGADTVRNKVAQRYRQILAEWRVQDIVQPCALPDAPALPKDGELSVTLFQITF